MKETPYRLFCYCGVSLKWAEKGGVDWRDHLLNIDGRSDHRFVVVIGCYNDSLQYKQ